MSERKNTGRRLALLSLVRIEKEGAYANRILSSFFAKYQPEEREKGLATEIVYGTLRHLSLVDYLLDRLLTKSLSSLPSPVRNILRLSLYQLLSRPRTPYAVVNEAVNLAKAEGWDKFSGLINAVLRRYLREGQKIILPGFSADPFTHLTVVHSHPGWLIERWMRRWRPDELHELVRINNLPAPFSIRTNTLKISREKLLAELSSAGIDATPSNLLPEALLISNPADLVDTPFFAAGYYYIQDEASMLVAHLVSPAGGEMIVDLCAAPGSKTTHLAQLMGDQGTIYALDDHPHKIDLIKENAERLGITCIKPVIADAREWGPGEELADGVLLDAPCTGTGVLRRRPDIRWRRSPEDLKELILLQKELLTKAASLVKVGGRVIYSTCSLEPEENEEQIREFLSVHPGFQVEIPSEIIRMAPGEALREGILILPQENGPDGFFLTRLVKTV